MELSKEDFFAYLLLYAANADMYESEEERDYILSRVPHDAYHKVHRIFEKDSDIERIEKITSNVKAHNYNHENPSALIDEIKKMMLSDGDIDAAEKTFLIGMKRLIMNAT